MHLITFSKLRTNKYIFDVVFFNVIEATRKRPVIEVGNLGLNIFLKHVGLVKNFKNLVIKSLSFGKIPAYVPSRSMENICKYKIFFGTLTN